MKPLLFTIALLLSFKSFAQQKKVLFLGNSYTFFNDMPQLFYHIAFSAGDNLIVDSYSSGGARFSTHLNNTTSLEYINADQWDYVVLQGQSMEAAQPITEVETETFPYAQALCDSIRANNTCSQPVFFMTWGYQNGNPYDCPDWPPVCTYEGMDSLVQLRYRLLGEMNEAFVSPVGAVWRYVRENHPSINLYNADQSHPSPAGSYLAACTFYSIILQKSPDNIQYSYSLSIGDALNIRNAVREVAFNNLDYWYVNAFDPQSDFDFSYTNLDFNFINNSSYAENYTWLFGDGNSSTDANPSHTYASDGVYTVQLISEKCGLADTSSLQINTETLGIPSHKNTSIRCYPNPSNQWLVLENIPNNSSLSLINSAGKELMNEKALYTKHSFNLQDLNLGVYFIKIESAEGEIIHSQKVIKF